MNLINLSFGGIMQHKELTHTIIGCAMKVHNVLGSGFPEIIYQRALTIEFNKSKLNFTRESELPIIYDDVEIGSRRIDFFVEGKILVEIKAISKLEDIHLCQVMNYCEVFELPFGLLINFGGRSLEFKRIYKKN
jgi:GxxExxY protein